MKLRQPALKCPAQPFESEPETNRWSESFEVTTLTPIYGGGVKAGEPDLSMPVRASAIRGQLRFWWRLLKRHHPESEHRVTDPRELFIAERELWGGMAENDQNYASKVRIRVLGINHEIITNLKKPCAEYERDHRNQGKYRSVPKFAPEVQGYALFPGQGKLSKDRRTIEKAPAEIIFPPFPFTLKVECPKESEQEVFETLRWWASFSGLGARTRRGLGAMRIKGLAAVTEAQAKLYSVRLIQKSPVPDPFKAWCKAVDALQHFRQGVNLGRNPETQPNKPGRSRWPEPESIRNITGVHRIKADGTSFAPVNPSLRDFPRTAFGLPIIFHFQNIINGPERDQQFDPDDCELKPFNYDRMASPLILKPVALDIGPYAPIALLLPHEHIGNLNLQLRDSGVAARNPNLPNNLAAGAWWPANGPDQLTNAESIRPMRDYQGAGATAVDALTAFMNYFAKG